MNVLLTGAAGLVGSQMIDALLKQGAKVFAVDNLSLGTERHLEEFRKQIDFEKWDVSKRDWHQSLRGKKFDTLIHLAANSDISLGHAKPWMDCERTFSTTFETLLSAKDMGIPNYLFASSSAVYGNTNVFPTPESLPNMHPVSIYGSGKLASENFISSFVNNYGLNAWVFRFGNVVGKKLTHGVIYDFVKKLRADPGKLEVLGNGQQHKTYIHVEDTVGGMLHALSKSKPGQNHPQKFQVFNLSSDGATTVRHIAEETSKALTGGKAKIIYGSDSIGWVGDVPKTSLNIERMGKLGWAAKYGSDEAVEKSIRDFAEWSK